MLLWLFYFCTLNLLREWDVTFALHQLHDMTISGSQIYCGIFKAQCVWVSERDSRMDHRLHGGRVCYLCRWRPFCFESSQVVLMQQNKDLLALPCRGNDSSGSPTIQISRATWLEAEEAFRYHGEYKTSDHMHSYGNEQNPIWAQYVRHLCCSCLKIQYKDIALIRMFLNREVTLNRAPECTLCSIQVTVMKPITFNLGSLRQLCDGIIGLHN